MENFIERFHTLKGIQIGERRKAFFILLRDTRAALNLECKEFDFSQVQPKTPLEEAFFVEILIFFQNTLGLLEILKTENQRLIAKVLKISPRLINELVQIMDANQIVEDFFPKLSFTTKEKLITKLALHLQNADVADLIFGAIKNRYGMYLAAKLLPSCSEEVILTSTLLKVELTSTQLLLIVRKYPQITETLINSLLKFSNEGDFKCKYSTVYKHIAQTDIVTFLKLNKSHNTKLGICATKKLISANKDTVIINANRLRNVLHKKQVVKSLHKDFTLFYSNMFPKTLAQFQLDYKSYLESFNKLPSTAKKVDLLSACFKKQYDDEIWNHTKLITPQLLELMTEDERRDWMRNHKRPDTISEIVWICLLCLEDSIPQLKNKISLTSDYEKRAELVGCLVETCRINGNNKEVLLDVCKYVLQHHRGDDFCVLYCFLDSLKNCFPMLELLEQHWNQIYKVIDLFITKNTSSYYYQDWYFGYLYFCYKKGLSVREKIKAVYTKLEYRFGWDTHDCRENQIKYERHCLTMLDEIINELEFTEECSFDSAYINYINSLLQWNKKYPKNYIDILKCKNVSEFILKQFQSSVQYPCLSEYLIVAIIQSSCDETQKLKLMDEYFNRKTFCIDVSLMMWLLKYHPLRFSSYLEKITKEILGLWYTMVQPFIWKLSLNYTHLDIPQKVINICLECVEEEGEDYERFQRNSTTALSCLMKTTEFLNFIVPYYPTGSVMDVDKQENMKIYKLQQAITVSLKNVIPASLIFESLIEFSKGDYTKFIQRALYSAAYNAAEENVPQLLRSLTDRPVSVRKHVTYITFRVLDRASIYSFLNSIILTEKNPSILKFIFNGTFRFFTKNPDDYLWDQFQKFAKLLHSDDKECFTALLEIEKVFKNYLTFYLVFVWNLLDKFIVTKEELTEGKTRLLNAVLLSDIPSLPQEFCLEVIRNFLKNNEKIDDSVVDFICKWIIGGAEYESEERLTIVFGLVHEYTKKIPNDENRLTDRFVKNYCKFFLSRECKSEYLLKIFVEKWNALFKPHEGFKEYLNLNITLLCVKYFKTSSLVAFSQELASWCDGLFSTYTCAIANIFGATVKSFFCYLFSEDNGGSVLDLIQEILKVNTSANCLLLIIYLLPRDKCITKAYHRILEILESSNDATVYLALSSYYKDIQDNNKLPCHDNNHSNKPRRQKNVRKLYNIQWVINTYQSETRYLY